MKKIPVCGKPGTIIAWALVDDEDFVELDKFRWMLSQDGHVFRRNGDVSRLMARQIMGIKRSAKARVIHIDYDKLNNQKSNLQVEP